MATATPAGQATAPAFTGTTLTGAKVSFPADYRGKLVLLDFWATWCGPCRIELPNVRAAHQKLPSDKFAILGVTLDELQRVPPERVTEFVQAEKLPWPQIYQGALQIAGQYGVAGIPAAFLVDGDTGAIVARGDELHGSALERTILAQLAARK